MKPSGMIKKKFYWHKIYLKVTVNLEPFGKKVFLRRVKYHFIMLYITLYIHFNKQRIHL